MDAVCPPRHLVRVGIRVRVRVGVRVRVRGRVRVGVRFEVRVGVRVRGRGRAGTRGGSVGARSRRARRAEIGQASSWRGPPRPARYRRDVGEI